MRRATVAATSAPWSHATMCRQRSMPAPVPADVMHVVVGDVEHVRIDVDSRDSAPAGARRTSSASSRACRRGGPRPRGRTRRCRSRRCARRGRARSTSARTSAGGGGTSGSIQPGTTIVSARPSARSPCVASSTKPVCVRTRRRRRRRRGTRTRDRRCRCGRSRTPRTGSRSRTSASRRRPPPPPCAWPENSESCPRANGVCRQARVMDEFTIAIASLGRRRGARLRRPLRSAHRVGADEREADQRAHGRRRRPTSCAARTTSRSCPTSSWDDVGKLDLLVLPGGDTRPLQARRGVPRAHAEPRRRAGR